MFQVMVHVKSSISTALLTSLLLTACQQSNAPISQGTSVLNSSVAQNSLVVNQAISIDNAISKENFFTLSHHDIALEKANRRKWDNAVIADIDHDGFLDLLLTDHGFSIKLYWNNQGKYGKGIDLLVGDTHGIAVSDFNKDGITDVIVARGGGSGANARNAKLFHINDQRKIVEGEEFTPPFKKIRGRTVKFYDGNNNADLDLLMLGFPGGKKEEVPSFSYKNDGNGQLLVSSALPKTQRDGQKLLETDFNNDGISDFILYGDGAITAHQGKGDLTFTDVTKQVFSAPIEHVTSIAEIDVDNDGDFDLFLTRGKEYLAGETFHDKNNQTLAFYTKRGKSLHFELTLGDTFSIKNYQSQWPSQDIFIGESAYKYEHQGEHHQGQDVKLINSNALGWPDKQDQKGLYVGYIGNNKWRVTINSWSPTTGVIEGVTQFNATTPLPGLSNVLLENKSIDSAGVDSSAADKKRTPLFIDVTQSLGLLDQNHSNAAAIADFDNNGYQDIVVIERGNLATKNALSYYENTPHKGNARFTKLPQKNLSTHELGAVGLGIEALDYNSDGKVDILYNNERGQWHLAKNVLENNGDANVIRVMVGQSPKEKASALGALVTITACENKQRLKVGSTAARYSQSLNNQLTFGLGACDKIDDITIVWPNGEALNQGQLTHSTQDSIKINSSIKW